MPLSALLPPLPRCFFERAMRAKMLPLRYAILPHIFFCHEFCRRFAVMSTRGLLIFTLFTLMRLATHDVALRRCRIDAAMRATPLIMLPRC